MVGVMSKAFTLSFLFHSGNVFSFNKPVLDWFMFKPEWFILVQETLEGAMLGLLECLI